MKARPECLVCLLKQALNTAKVVTDDPAKLAEVCRRVGALIPSLSLEDTPARVSQPAYDMVAAVTGVRDPFLKEKRQSNREALALLPRLEALEAAAADPLDTALHLAVAGNIIDLGIGHAYDLEKDVRALLRRPFAIDASADFRAELRPGARILYLGDNAGEIVFDRVLVEELLRRGTCVTFAVKSGPVINDATREDAETAGIAALVPVIETGSNDIGVGWDRCSDEFRRAFEAADIIISKGQGNFETCDGRPGNIYFLLKTKCECVAQELGVALGEIVFKHQRI